MVGTHMLPPQLLRLFAPRPPLPYAKPLGRDPDVPLKNKATKPSTLSVADALQMIRTERERAENAAFEQGDNPDEVTDDKTKQEAELAQGKGQSTQSKRAARAATRKAKEDEDAAASAATATTTEQDQHAANTNGVVTTDAVKKEEDGAKPKPEEDGEIPEATHATAAKAVADAKKRRDPEVEAIEKLPVNDRPQARRELKKKRHEQLLADGIKNCKSYWPSLTLSLTDNPHEDREVVGDPYKTLFVSRIPKDVSESELRREFDLYGPLERLRLVRDAEGKSKGYAFIVYERERDMKAAYKDADGLKLHGKRLMIDVERGRTVKDWKPRRLGGGLGGRPKKAVPVPMDMGPPMGGFRGGFRGGFGGRGGGRGGFVQRGGFGGPRGGGGGFRGGFGGGGGGRGGFQGQSGPDSGYGSRAGGGGGGFGGEKRGFDNPAGGYGDSKRPRY
ncbi:hypothetical protein OIV83_002694 [Microbotryomycetes sp. JL201]|nr:hypothetical protein OIV83_002694 [Microbotryomycetes sp. JL201]